MKSFALLSLLLAPLLWLWPSVFGERVFVPYDLAQFPPVAATLSPEQLAAARAGANTDVTEVPVWFLPELVLARDELAAGALPTWNPYARTGAPLHAHGLIGLLYPPNWLALFAAEPAQRLGVVAWVNLALAGLLAFGLLRQSGRGLLAAWFGALLFQLSAPLATNAFFWMRLGSLVWLPGVLWAVLAMAHAERIRARHVTGLAIAFAMTWLAGFPPFAAATTVLGGAAALWVLMARLVRGGNARALTLGLAIGFGCGGMLAAPQVLPSLQFFPHSARETKPEFQRIADSAYDSYGLLGFVLPDAFGHPTKPQAEVPYGPQNVLGLLWNTRTRDEKPTHPNFNYTEYAVFVGHLGLLLALLGALLGRGRALPLMGWLLCAGLALFAPGVRLLFLLPVVENVWPMRWLAPGTLFVAWLAALGCERLLAAGRAAPLLLAALASAGAVVAWRSSDVSTWSEADSRAVVQRLAAKFSCDELAVVNHVGTSDGIDRFRAAYAQLAGDAARQVPWLLGTAVLLAACALLRERARAQLLLAAGVGTALQLGLHGATVTHGSERTLDATASTNAWRSTPVHAFLRERAAAMQASGGVTIVRGSRGRSLPQQLPPGELMVRGLRDLNFYSHADARLLQPLRALLGPLGDIAEKGYLTSAVPEAVPDAGNERHPFASPWLDLLGVRYVLATETLEHAGTRLDGPGVPPGFFVYERRTALPRAFTVGDVIAHERDEQVVQALLAGDFAPARTAHALASDLPAVRPAAAADAQPRAVRFVRDDPTCIELDVDAGTQAWLVLADTFLPGWNATVDGQPVSVHRVDHAFRLVLLPTTKCRVVFTYAAPGLATGAWLAVAGALGLVLWWFATRTVAPRTAPTR